MRSFIPNFPDPLKLYQNRRTAFLLQQKNRNREIPAFQKTGFFKNLAFLNNFIIVPVNLTFIFCQIKFFVKKNLTVLSLKKGGNRLFKHPLSFKNFVTPDNVVTGQFICYKFQN